MNICGDMLKIPLPLYLQGHADQIRHIFNNVTTKWRYNASDWLREFRDDLEVGNDLKEIMKECPQDIQRSHVQSYARKIRSGAYKDIRRLFIACMMWGYGEAKYGPSNTKKSLSDTRIRKILQDSVGRIKNNQIKEAYEEFDPNGCGPVSLTKFFYVVGREHNIKPLPLILDRHVANSLEYLSKLERCELSTFVRVKSRGQNGKIVEIERFSGGYVQYICSMEDWATEISCPADNIEYFMYLMDKGQADGTVCNNEKRTNQKIPTTDVNKTPPAISLSLQLPKYFKGNIVDQRGKDKDGWARRGIVVPIGQSYPRLGDSITLVDSDGDKYQLQFFKSRKAGHLWLGQQKIFKKWYRKNYSPTHVKENEVYFVYSGYDREFKIYTSNQFGKRSLE